MNTRQAHETLAPFINRHNVRSFRFALDREAFARAIATDAGAAGEDRLAFNLLLEAMDEPRAFRFVRNRDGAERIIHAPTWPDAVNILAREKPDPKGPFSYDSEIEA
jgi:hypothetical protein